MELRAVGPNYFFVRLNSLRKKLLSIVEITKKSIEEAAREKVGQQH